MIQIIYTIALLLGSIVQQHIDTNTRKSICPANQVKIACTYELEFSQFLYDHGAMSLYYNVRHGKEPATTGCVSIPAGDYRVYFTRPANIKMSEPFRKTFKSYVCQSKPTTHPSN